MIHPNKASYNYIYRMHSYILNGGVSNGNGSSYSFNLSLQNRGERWQSAQQAIALDVVGLTLEGRGL